MSVLAKAKYEYICARCPLYDIITTIIKMRWFFCYTSDAFWEVCIQSNNSCHTAHTLRRIVATTCERRFRAQRRHCSVEGLSEVEVQVNYTVDPSSVRICRLIRGHCLIGGSCRSAGGRWPWVSSFYTLSQQLATQLARFGGIGLYVILFLMK